MARGRRNNCRLCMKPTLRNDSTTINNFPQTFAYLLEEISGIKFTQADGLQINVCNRCRDFIHAMESHSEYPQANKISGAGRRKVRRLMDKGISPAAAIEKVIAEKRARDLINGSGLPVQQNFPVQNIMNPQMMMGGMQDLENRRMSGAQRKKFVKLVGGGMNADQARLLVLAAAGALAGANQPQQRGPPGVGGPVQGRLNVLQRPNGQKVIVRRNVTVQGGRVQKVARVVAPGAQGRLQKATGILKAPMKKVPPQKAGAGPAQKAANGPGPNAGNAQKGPGQKAPIQKGPGQKAPIQKGPGQKAPIQKGPGQKAPLQKKPVPNAPVNNSQPRQQQGNAPGVRPQNKAVGTPRRNDRPGPYNNNNINRGNNNQQNQYGPRNGNFNQQQNCPLEVGIVPINFPSVQLDEMKLEALKEAITNEIFKIPQGGPLIRFLGTTFENGWLKLICADQLSHDWLASLVARWERAGVRLVEGNALPQPVVLSVYLQGDFRSAEEILNILEKQNNSLQTRQWRIINREVDTSGQSITVCVDEQSFQALKSRDFMVFLGLGVVEFKPRRFPTDGGTFNNNNMRGQSANNNPNRNNKMNMNNMNMNNMNMNNQKNNSMGYSRGGNNSNNYNNKNGGGGGNGMGNNYQPNQKWSNNGGGGQYNKRQGMNQGQGNYQRAGYQNQRSW